MRINLSQIQTGQVADFIESEVVNTNYLTGIIDYNYISNLISNYVNNLNYLGSHVVYNTGLNQTIYGTKTFDSEVYGQSTNNYSGFITYAQLSGSGNLFYTKNAIDASGLLTTGNGVNYALKSAINSSGFQTGIPVCYNTFENLPINTGIIDSFFVQNTFTFTGYSLGLNMSGQSGLPLSGEIYQLTPTNNYSLLSSFSLLLGENYYNSGLTSPITVSGFNRLQVSLTSISSGLQGFTLGIFGITKLV